MGFSPVGFWRNSHRKFEWLFVLVGISAILGELAILHTFPSLVAVRITIPRILKLALLLVSLSIAILGFSKPKIAILAMITIAVLNQKITVFGHPSDASELALLALAPAFYSSYRFSNFKPAIKIWSFFAASSAFLTFVFSNNLGWALYGFVRLLLILNFGFALMAIDGVWRQRNFTRWLLGLGAIAAILGLLQGRGIYFFVGEEYSANRIDSTFGYYTVYGSFLATCTLLSIGTLLEFRRERKPMKALPAVILIILFTYSLIQNLSRGALLALAAGSLYLAIGSARRSRTWAQGMLILGFSLLCTYILVGQQALADLVRRFLTPQGGDALRHRLQLEGLRILKSHPEGIGTNDFYEYTSKGATNLVTTLAHSHNLYIQIGLDFGWLGLLVFLLLIFATLRRHLITAWSGAINFKTLSYGAAVFGFLAQGFVDYLFHETAVLIIFAVLIVNMKEVWRSGEKSSARNVKMYQRT